MCALSTEKLLKTLLYEKDAHNMLMKLTPRVDFTKLDLPSEKLPANSIWKINCRLISPTIFYQVKPSITCSISV